MKTYNIPHTELEVSRLAFGLGMFSHDWNESEFVSKAVAAARAAYECGITFFDTADVYAAGQSDVALGRLFRESPGLRNTIVVQSKCGIRIRGGWVPGAPIGVESLGVNLTAEHICQSVDGSLKNIATDRLDILLLHSPSPLIQPSEVAEAFYDLHKSGKVRYFGVSGHGAMQMEILQMHLELPIVANQIWLGLLHSQPISDDSSFGAIVDFCRTKKIQIQAYSPLKGEDIFAKPALLRNTEGGSPELLALRKLLSETAARYNVSVPAIMLAWLLRHPAGIAPILGASRSDHLRENCMADDVELSSEEWELLLECARRV